jgi:hypothetical protein
MGHVSKKLGLQDEIFTFHGQSNINVIRGVPYGKAKTTYHL